MNKSMIKDLHPMAIPLLTARMVEEKKANKRQSEFVLSAYSILSYRPEHLTAKWVQDINKWCDDILTGMSLEDPAGVVIGDAIIANNVTVVKRRSKKYGGFPALITQRDDGWKLWMVWPKAFDFEVKDKVNITGTVRDIQDGMIFLTRPSTVHKLK